MDVAAELLLLLVFGIFTAAAAYAWSRGRRAPVATLADGMQGMPSDVVAYKRVPATEGEFFTQETLPKLLRQRHNTKAGVWGKIVVVAGALLYTDLEGDGAEFLLTHRHYGVAQPKLYHKVTPQSTDMRCYILFHHLPVNSEG